MKRILISYSCFIWLFTQCMLYCITSLNISLHFSPSHGVMATILSSMDPQTPYQMVMKIRRLIWPTFCYVNFNCRKTLLIKNALSKKNMENVIVVLLNLINSCHFSSDERYLFSEKVAKVPKFEKCVFHTSLRKF